MVLTVNKAKCPSLVNHTTKKIHHHHPHHHRNLRTLAIELFKLFIHLSLVTFADAFPARRQSKCSMGIIHILQFLVPKR